MNEAIKNAVYFIVYFYLVISFLSLVSVIWLELTGTEDEDETDE